MHLEDVWKLTRGEPSGLQEGQDLTDRWTQVDSGGKQLFNQSNMPEADRTNRVKLKIQEPR